MDKFENARNNFQPDKVRVLFIAESRPANGEFIYHENSELFDAFLTAFKAVFPDVNRNNLLNYMKDNGYYLDDLCLIPVNQMRDSKRCIERINGVKELSIRIKSYNPKHIVCIMKSIMPYIDIARQLSGINLTEIISTSFPAYTEINRQKFHNDMVNFLRTINR